MSFKQTVENAYEVTALEKNISNQLAQSLKGKSLAERQSALDKFVVEHTINKDDLSDLMYDLERAGHHDLKKPKPKTMDLLQYAKHLRRTGRDKSITEEFEKNSDESHTGYDDAKMHEFVQRMAKEDGVILTNNSVSLEDLYNGMYG